MVAPVGRRRRLDAGMLLLLTPLVWGATFPGAKIALRHLEVLPFMAWTRALGLASIVLLLPLGGGAGAVSRRALIRATWPGALLGALMFCGYLLQTEGLARTTATNAGFITGLYVVFTPIIAASAFRARIRRAAWRAVIVSLAGLTLLSVHDLGHVRLHAGDLLVLAGAVAWAGHIAAVGHLSRRSSPMALALSQMGFTALFHLIAALPSGLATSHALSSDVWPLLLLAGVLGSGVGFTLQVVAQRRLSAARAVVLLAGESLFSAAFSAVWIGERLSAHQWVGAALVLVAMAYSELTSRRSPDELIDPAAVP
jgi:drug/metabolite transporter (DMT)-like permease